MTINTNLNALSALLVVPRRSFVEETVNLLTQWLDCWAPEGYEDETGFHFGSETFEYPGSSLDGPIWLGEHI